jgi:hypothetical protein
MNNFKIRAKIMRLGTAYRNGSAYENVTWDKEALATHRILVGINFMFTKDNIVGIVNDLFKEGDFIVADIILNTDEDEDILMRLKKSIFIAGVTEKNKVDLNSISDPENMDKVDVQMIAYINSVGMIPKTNLPFSLDGDSAWTGMGKTSESAKPNVVIQSTKADIEMDKETEKRIDSENETISKNILGEEDKNEERGDEEEEEENN